MIKIIQSIERHHLEKETPYYAYQWFKQNDEKSESVWSLIDSLV